MIPLPFLPKDTQLEDVDAGTCRVELGGRHDCRMHLAHGVEFDWLSMTASWPDSRGSLTRLWAAQTKRRAIKVIPDAAGGQPQIRAELPVPRGTWSQPTLQWAGALFRELTACLALDSNAADACLQSEPLAELLADPGYPTETQDDGTVLQRVPAGSRTRAISWRVEGDWLRGESAIGMGVRFPRKDPMETALSYHLLKLSACTRMARAHCHLHEDDTAAVSFLVDLPRPIDSLRLHHGIRALITGIDRFEQEIEHLATEADLAHAYVTLHRNAFKR